MNNVYFIFFSAFEYLSIILIGFILFRIRFNKRKVLYIITSSLILSLLSLTLNLLDLSSIAPLIQMIVIVPLFKICADRLWLHSAFVSIASYVLYGGIQFLLVLALSISVEKTLSFTTKGYMLQMLSFFVVTGVLYTIKIFNGGFSFDLDEPESGRRINKSRIYTLLTGLVTMTSFSFWLYQFSKDEANLNFFFVLMCLCAISMLHISYKYDMTQEV